jgi:hypothetical protein
VAAAGDTPIRRRGPRLHAAPRVVGVDARPWATSNRAAMKAVLPVDWVETANPAHPGLHLAVNPTRCAPVSI